MSSRVNTILSTRSRPSPDKIISGISLILDFGFGHDDRSGKYYGNYSQADVVNEYGRRVGEELDTDGIRLFPVETRKSPGTKTEYRHKVGPLTFAPVILSCGWDETDKLHNCSQIEYQGAQYLALAERIAESLSDWGRCYVWGHKVSKPNRIAESGDDDEQRGYIRVSPFSLNGPHSDSYLERLERLGEGVGRAISGYLIERGAAKR